MKERQGTEESATVDLIQNKDNHNHFKLKTKGVGNHSKQKGKPPSQPRNAPLPWKFSPKLRKHQNLTKIKGTINLHRHE